MDEFEELGDEFPDIHSLFMYYNDLYFGGVLLGNTTVEWSSSRMTSCGGICKYHPLMGCQIRLSEPLLKLRPVRDMKMVLLHEMIHAHNMTLKVRDPDPGGHGPPFVDLMNKINNSSIPDAQRPPGGYRITTTHSMIGEVENYRTHWWECQRCGKVIKRSMNRPPQEADCIGRTGSRGDNCRDPNCGYHTHLRNCGGQYIKTREPDPKPKRKKSPAKKPPPSLPRGQQRIDSVAVPAGAAAGSAHGRGAKRPAGPLPEDVPAKAPGASGGGAAAASGSGSGAGGSRSSEGASGSQRRPPTPAQPQPQMHQPPLQRLWGQARGSAGGAGGGGAAGSSSGAASGPGSQAVARGSRPGSPPAPAPAAPQAAAPLVAPAAAGPGPASSLGPGPGQGAEGDGPSAEELRRRCAEAAIARLQGRGRPPVQARAGTGTAAAAGPVQSRTLPPPSLGTEMAVAAEGRRDPQPGLATQGVGAEPSSRCGGGSCGGALGRVEEGHGGGRSAVADVIRDLLHSDEEGDGSSPGAGRALPSNGRVGFGAEGVAATQRAQKSSDGAGSRGGAMTSIVAANGSEQPAPLRRASPATGSVAAPAVEFVDVLGDDSDDDYIVVV